MTETAPATENEQEEGEEAPTITPDTETGDIESDPPVDEDNKSEILEQKTDETTQPEKKDESDAGEVQEVTKNADETGAPVKVSLAQIVYNEAGTSVVGYESLSDAEVVFEGQTVDFENGEFIADIDKANILFKVTPDDGKKIKEVKFATAEKDEDFEFDKKPALKSVRGTVSPANPNEELAVTDKTVDLSDKKRNVRIFVGVADVTYDVNIPLVSGNGAYVKAADAEKYNFAGSTTTSKAGLKYGESFTFAVKDWTKAEDVTLKATVPGTPGGSGLVLSPNELSQTESNGSVTNYLEYTLYPLDVPGIERTNTDTVTVAIVPTADIAVSVDSTCGIKKTAVPGASPARYVFENTVVKSEAGITAATIKDLAAGSSYTTKDKVVFGVSDGDDRYVLIPPTAYWADASLTAGSETDDQKNEIAVNKKTAENGVEYYEIDLAEITKAARLYVQIEGELDGDNDYVKTVTFAGGSHVKAAEGANVAPTDANNILGKSKKTEGSDYTFTVKPDTGYVVTGIEFVTEKTFEDGSTATETTNRDADGTKLAADAKLDPFSTQENIVIPFSGTDTEEGQPDKNWTSKKVTVNITTGIQTSKTDKVVTFASKGNYTDETKGAYTYQVTTVEDKVIQDPAEKEKFTVKAGTEYLEFTVKADTKPVIKVGTNDKIAEAVESSEGFTYRIPAVSLGSEATVWIERAKKKIEINYNDPAAASAAGALQVEVGDADADVDVSGSLAYATTGLKEGYNHKAYYNNLNVDAKIKVTVKTTGQAPITAVNYQVKGGSVQSAEYNATEKYWEFEVKATDDIDVDVVKSTDKKLVLNKIVGNVEGAELEPDEDGVYSVSYKEKIVARLFNDETPLTLYSTSVKTVEGKNAKTAATIDKADSSNSAKIEVVEKEYGEVLTVTLVTLKDRTPVSFKIRTETPIEGVTYENDKLTDGKIVLPVDTKTEVKVTMNAKNSKIENLRVAVIGATAKTIGSSPALTGSGVTVVGTDPDEEGALVNGAFTIKADAQSTGKKNSAAAKIVLYDNNDDKKTIIAGSEILVNTADATVFEKAPTLSAGTASAKSIRINITSPEGVEEDLVAGDVWYKIEVTKPKSLTGLSDAAKSALNRKFTANTLTETVKKSRVDAEGGYAFSVFDQKYLNKDGDLVDFPGAAVSGFGVKVTLVQTTTKNQADAASSNIKGKTESIELATQNPSYEDSKNGKLKLKNGQTTLYTGNTNWVAVAAPEFASAKYGAVDVSFVDTKTGKAKAHPGMTARYNDVTNQVEVQFTAKTERDGNGIETGWYRRSANGDYKDLAVRVMALTEDTGYGVSGDVKLNVVNGIESINASVQPYVKKEAGKAASFKVETNLNFSDAVKARAPKYKKVTYSIVGTGAALDGNYNLTNAATPLSSYVTVKGDKITVAKDYAISKTKSDNQFKILATAEDYDGNTLKEILGTTVEITSESQPMGSLQVMKKVDTDKYVLAGTSLTVRSKNVNDEYRLVVLNANVAADRASYKAADFAPTASFSFTPNKANGSVVVNADGWITVNKLGKATLAAVDKSDKKNKQNLKVEFIQTATPLELEISKYEGSALNNVQNVWYDNVEFSGNNNTLFGINVVEKVDKNYRVVNLSDAKVTVKNAKIVTPKDADWNRLGIGAEHRRQYVIAPTGNPVTVTLKSKKATKTYTINNTAYKSGKSSLKVSPLVKGQKVSQDERNQRLSFKVEGKNVDLEGRYVVLSVDNTKKSPIDAAHAFVSRTGWTNADVTKTYTDCALALRDEGMFDVEMSPANAGTYYLNVAVGVLNGGIFTQEYPDVKLAVKVTKKGSVNLKVTNKYTLDPIMASVTDIQYNKKDDVATFANEAVDGNYAMNAIIGDQENKFRDYFEARAAVGGVAGEVGTIGLRSDLTEKQLAEITSDPKSPHLTGYIRVQNRSKVVDVKITINFKDLLKGLKAQCVPVLAGSDVTVDVVLMNGKNRVPVQDFTVDGTEFKKDSTDAFANPIWNAAKTEVLGGDIRLKGANITEGKKTVTVRVTPLNTLSFRQDKPKQYAISVPVTINVLKSNAKNKVQIAKGQNNWVVESWNYVGPDDKKVHAQGSWQGNIEYSFKNALSIKEGTKINVACGDKDPDFISFASDDYSVANEFQTLTPIVDKAKLAAAIAANGKKFNWGKKITVTANFTYGDAKNPTTLEKDSAKITITLPGQPGAELTDGKVFEEAEPYIRNTIATMTDHYSAVKKTGDDCNIYSDDIRDRIKGSLLYAANGATVTVIVTHNQEVNKPSTALATTYKATVKDASGKTIYGEKTFNVVDKSLLSAATVRNSIRTLSATDWALTGVTNENLTGTVLPDIKTVTALQTEVKKRLSASITAADYAKLIHEVLVKTGKTDDRFSISVKIKSVTAPKVGTAGSLVADVHVTDQSVAPTDGVGTGNEKWSARLEDVTYALPAIQAVDAATSAVSTDLAAEATIKKLVGDTWKSTAKVGDTWESEEFQSKLQEAIVARANEKIAGDGTVTANPYLKATGIEKDTFELTMANNTNTWKVTAIKYNLLLTDSTPGAADKDLEIAINSGAVNYDIPEFMTLAGLKAEIEKKENRVIASAATKEAAYKLIEAKIRKIAAVNPALDLSELAVGDHTSKVFVAPKNNNNGTVNAYVLFKKGSPNVASDLLNVVILAKGEDFTVPSGTEDEDVAKEKEKARVTSVVQSTLTRENIAKLMKDTYIAWTKEEQGNMAASDNNIVAGENADANDVAIRKLLAAKVAEALTGSGYTLKDTTDTNNNIVTDPATFNFAAPVSSTERVNIIAFKVTLRDTDNTEDLEVPIKAMTLDVMKEFQSLAEIKDALVRSTLTTQNMDVRNVTITTTGATEDPADSGIFKSIQSTTELDALGAAVVEKLSEKSVITNPLYSLVCNHTNGPTGSSGADARYKKLAAGGRATFEVTGWEVFIHSKAEVAQETAATNKVSLAKITVLSADKTPSVTSIKFGKVDEHTVVYDSGGIKNEAGNGTSSNPVAVSIKESHDHFQVTIDEIEQSAAAEGTTYGQNITWKVTRADDTALTTGNTDGAGAITWTGDASGIDITVPGTVHGDASRQVTLKITAESDGKNAAGAQLTAFVYAKLTLKPYVSEFNIVPANTTTPGNGEFIELDGSTKKNTNGVAYKAELKGSYLKTTDSTTALTWSVDDAANNKAMITGGTLKWDTDGAAPDTVKSVKVKAAFTTLSNYEGTTSAEKTVEVRRTGDTSETLKVVLGQVDGVEYDEMFAVSPATPTPKIIVTGRSVKIPLSVEGDNTTRAWTYTVKNASDNSALSSPYSGIVVQPSTETSKTAYLVIPNVDEIADEVLNADGTAVATPAELKITVDATSRAGSSLSAKTAASYTAGLVVKKSVTGIKLQQCSATDGTVQTGDTGSGEIGITAGTTSIYVKSELSGNHMKATELKQVSYKITDRSENMRAASLNMTKLGVSDNVITLQNIPNAVGFVEITASYGTGSDKVTASRVVNVKSATTYAITKHSDPATGCTSDDGSSITVDKAHSADPTVKYEVSGQTPTWTLINVDSAIEDYVSISSGGVVTINSNPAGYGEDKPALAKTTTPYHFTVKASWTDAGSGNKYTRTKGVELNINRVITAITAGDITASAGITVGGSGDARTITKEVAGTITIPITYTGERTGNATANDLLTYTISYDGTAGKVTVVNTATAVPANGSIVVTIPTLESNSGAENTKKIIVTINAKTETGLTGLQTAKTIVFTAG